MGECVVIVPGVPPSVNHMYRRFTRHGRRMQVTTAEAQAWMTRTTLLARTAARKAGWQLRPRGEQTVVQLWFSWPDNRRRDSHNTLKPLMDALEGVLYEDDRDALPQVMGVEVDRHNPRIVIVASVPEEVQAG